MLKNIIGHDDIKESLKVLLNRLPTLLLFIGPKGVGKQHTAINLIDELYKGSFGARILSHPDILILEPDTKVFKLELVVKMKDFISETAFELDEKFVIMRGVDLMNKESANACLKVFEDAPPNTYFILLAENEELVLNTIKSRSTAISFSPVKDLKKYLPDLSEIEVKLMGGCIGKRKTLEDFGVDLLYNETLLLLSTYEDINYDNIIDWYIEHKDIDIPLLNSIFLIASQNLAKKNKYLNTTLLFLKSCNQFKDKTSYSIKLDMHFKNMIIQNKAILDSKEIL